MADQKTIDLINQQNLLLEKQAELRAKIDKIQDSSLTDLDIQLRKSKEVSSELAKQITLVSEDKVIRDELIKNEISYYDKRINDEKLLTQEEIKRYQVLQAIQNTDEKDLETLKKQLETKLKLKSEEEKLLEARRAGVAAAKGMAENFAQLLGFSKGMTGQLLKGIAAGNGLKDNFKAIGGVLKSSFGPSGILAFAVTNTILMANKLDGAVASFASITGQGRSYTGVITGAFRSTSQFGATLEDSSKAASDLFVTFNSFNKIADSTKQAFTENAIALEKLGMAAAITGEIARELQFAFAQTPEQAMKFSSDLARIAINLGAAPAQLQNQFADLLPTLSLFGSDFKANFNIAAKAAKDLGFDMRGGVAEIFKLAEGFQSFESAAERVASLNLVLGGSFVNTFDMVMAAGEGPIAQLKMLQDAFQASGRSLDDMGFYERKFLADQLGISFSNLQKLVKGEITEEEAMMSSEEQLAEHIKATTTVLTKLQSTLQNLSGPFTKVLEAMLPLVEGFATFIGEAGGMKLIIPAVLISLANLGTGLMGVVTKFNATTSAAVRSKAAFAGVGKGALAIMGGAFAADVAMGAGASKEATIGGSLGMAAIGGMLMKAPHPAAKGIGMMMLTMGGGGAITGLMSTPDVSRQSGGSILPGQSAKTHTGELMVINAPGSGAEVFSQKAMTNYTNALRDHTRAVSSDSGASQMSEMTKELKKINNNLSSGGNEKPIQVNLVLNRRGGEIIASQTIDMIERNFNPDGTGRMST